MTGRMLSATETDRSNMKHGTTHAYKQGCRCDECKAAKKSAKAAEYQRHRQRQITGESSPGLTAGRPSIPLSARPHGNYVTYCKGCRCQPCTEANTEYGRDRRAERELDDMFRYGT